MNFTTKQLALSELSTGMTVIHNNAMVTVNKKDLKHCPLMGVSFRGDASIKTITAIQFIVPLGNGQKRVA